MADEELGDLEQGNPAPDWSGNMPVESSLPSNEESLIDNRGGVGGDPGPDWRENVPGEPGLDWHEGSSGSVGPMHGQF